jgi:hypothetical protein
VEVLQKQLGRKLCNVFEKRKENPTIYENTPN